MKILISGGGMGGIMLAALLEQRGIGCEIVERASDWNSQGYSLGVWSNTRTLFAELGMAAEFDSAGVRMRTYDLFDTTGRPLRSVRFDRFYERYGMAYTQVSRQALHSLALSRVERARIRHGVEIQSLSQAADKVEIRLSDGTAGAYDLIVGADGIGSTLRKTVFGPGHQRWIGWRAWYVFVPGRFVPEQGMVEYLGPGTCIALFDEGPRALGIFFSSRVIAHGSDATMPKLQKLKELFPISRGVLSGIFDGADEASITETALSRVTLRDWTKGRVALIGDAAHGFEPHTGLGGGMAMEDASSLAHALSKVPRSCTLAEALSEYQRIRNGRQAIASRLTSRIRKLSFVKTAPARMVANLIVGRAPDSWFLRDYFRLLDG